MMTKFISLFIFLLTTLSAFNSNAQEYGIVCGKIKNNSQVLDLTLRNDFVIYPSYNLQFKTDSLGNFKIKVPVIGLTQLWLTDTRPHGIPIFLNKGDSIYLEFDLSNKEYPEYLKNVRFSGRYQLEQLPYTLFKNSMTAHDSVYYYKKILSPDKFKNYCMNQSNKEKERLTKDLSIIQDSSFFLEYSKLFWTTLLFRYTFPPRDYKGSYPDYFTYLDSLGYFSFLDSLSLNNENVIFCSVFSILIGNIFNYPWITENINSQSLTDYEELDYIKNNYSGLLQQGLLTFHIHRHIKFETKEERAEIINKYITNKKMNAALFQENLRTPTLMDVINNQH
jgi:hypothetical protein